MLRLCTNESQLDNISLLIQLWDYLQVVIDYFNSRLDSLNTQAGAAPEGQTEWSVDRVLELVQTFTQV